MNYCLCGHSIHQHFMDFGTCLWRHPLTNGSTPCDCHVFEQVDE